MFIATSLDGFIARRDGGIDWLSIVETPGEDYGYARFFADVDALILGRGTYDTALGFPGVAVRRQALRRLDARIRREAGTASASTPVRPARCWRSCTRPASAASTSTAAR